MGAPLILKYRDDVGGVTERPVYAIGLRDHEDTLNAYCQTRRKLRSFSIKRIVEAIDPITGEIVSNLGAWLTEAGPIGRSLRPGAPAAARNRRVLLQNSWFASAFPQPMVEALAVADVTGAHGTESGLRAHGWRFGVAWSHRAALDIAWTARTRNKVTTWHWTVAADPVLAFATGDAFHDPAELADGKWSPSVGDRTVQVIDEDADGILAVDLLTWRPPAPPDRATYHLTQAQMLALLSQGTLPTDPP